MRERLHAFHRAEGVADFVDDTNNMLDRSNV